MNTLLLHPSDILFFRDGRPMGGSLAGHGAAWPLPTVTNAALHAALHRASIEGAHAHRRGRNGDYSEKDEHRDRKFGSLATAGPFPVCIQGLAHTWFFPRPLDAGKPDSTATTYHPLARDFDPAFSSLPKPLKFPVANTGEPSKDILRPWWSEGAWNTYLGSRPRDELAARPFFKSDSDFSDTEFNYGIGIDPATGTQHGERFYSAHYLRLRAGWKLGVLAEAHDKINSDPARTRDLIPHLFESENHVLVGGQQRLCSAELSTTSTLPLPLGKTAGFTPHDGKFLLKWILLTPAIFPIIGDHPGGWLPSWIDETGEVQLLDGPGRNAAKRRKVPEGKPIPATLVAAMTGKPIPVTGYALDNGLEDRGPGPKATHLAVPAGSVYYFITAEPGKLAAALNWHGTSSGTEIQNRRSTLMGEKGFGLGVCSAWNFHPGP